MIFRYNISKTKKENLRLHVRKIHNISFMRYPIKNKKITEMFAPKLKEEIHDNIEKVPKT